VIYVELYLYYTVYGVRFFLVVVGIFWCHKKLLWLCNWLCSKKKCEQIILLMKFVSIIRQLVNTDNFILFSFCLSDFEWDWMISWSNGNLLFFICLRRKYHCSWSILGFWYFPVFTLIYPWFDWYACIFILFLRIPSIVLNEKKPKSMVEGYIDLFIRKSSL
jgi:hypothetical protein